MPEIRIPDELEPDCGNCQGLCCMAMAHRKEGGFPIEQDKPGNVPCHNLETNPADFTNLYKCRIHETLDQEDWTTCTEFTCLGAGQAISTFFNELGISWALKSPDIDESKRQIMLKNLNAGYFVLYNVLGYLKCIKNKPHFSRDLQFQSAKSAAAEVAKRFGRALVSGEEIDKRHWYLNEFMPPMFKASNEMGLFRQ